MENEILAAEIYLHPVNTTDATRKIDEQLKKVERRIQEYTVDLSTADYAMAIASGIISGAIDAFVVGETDFFRHLDKAHLKEQAEDVFDRLKILFVEKPTAKASQFQRAVVSSPFTDNEILKAFTINRNPVGLLATILLQMGKGGMIQKDSRGKIRLFPEQNERGPFQNISHEDRVFLLIIAVIIGILRWLIVTAEDEPLNSSNHGFKTLGKLREMIRTTPAFSKTVDQIEKWQRQAVNEIRKIQKENGAAMGVDQVFLSFFTMLAMTPGFEKSNLHDVVRLYEDGKRIGLDRIPIIENLTRQAFPVLVNEIIVRTFYFAEHLVMELQQAEDINGIDWEKVIPLGNKSINRMMTIAALTLNTADIADAAVRAAIDSEGNLLCFGTRFLARFNLVAEGRAVVSVIREIRDEMEQQALYDERLRLQRTKTAEVLKILDKYQKELEERVSTYLAEDIEVFLKGIEMMDQGLNAKDSDLVIQGNVMIQRVLGREPQFTNQQEFDDLMDSDIPLKL